MTSKILLHTCGFGVLWTVNKRHPICITKNESRFPILHVIDPAFFLFLFIGKYTCLLYFFSLSFFFLHLELLDLLWSTACRREERDLLIYLFGTRCIHLFIFILSLLFLFLFGCFLYTLAYVPHDDYKIEATFYVCEIGEISRPISRFSFISTESLTRPLALLRNALQQIKTAISSGSLGY